MCKPSLIELMKKEESNRSLLIQLAKELRLAKSALYMEPLPMPVSEGPLLVDKDSWALHATEHIGSARDLVIELLKRIGTGKMD